MLSATLLNLCPSRQPNRRRIHRPAPQRRFLELECLEGRTLLSTINWTNRGTCTNFLCAPGTDSDRFGAVFGANAFRARAVVNAALADWAATIADFNYANVGVPGWAPQANTYSLQISAVPQAGSSLASSTITGIDPTGKPFQAQLRLDDNGGGAGWYFDPFPTDNAEFTSLLSRFTAYTSGGTRDFYRTVVHEVGHALGLDDDVRLRLNTGAFLTPAGRDQVDGTSALVRIATPDFTATLTRAGGLHLYEGPADPAFPGPVHPHDLMNHERSLSPFFRTRQLISDLDARLLQTVYGYTVLPPSQRETFLVNFDVATGGLTLNGDPQVQHDTIHIRSRDNDVNVVVNVDDVEKVFPWSVVRGLTVQASGGNDTILVDSLVGGKELTVNGGDGDDTIHLSPNVRRLITLDGTITVDGGPSGFDQLFASDSASSLHTAFRFDTGFVKVSIFPTGPERTIFHNALDHLEVRGGSWQSRMSVVGVTPGTNLALFGGSFDDVFGVHALSPFSGLTIHGGGGHDRLYLGLPSNLDTAYTFTNTQVEVGPVSCDPLSCLVSRMGYSGVEELWVNAGSGHDQFLVQSTLVFTAIDAGAGNDTVVVGTATSSLSAIQGRLVLDGEGGNDSLTIIDQAAAAPRDYQVRSDAVLVNMAFLISRYEFFERLTLIAGPQDDRLTVWGTLATTLVTTLNMGAGNDTISVGTASLSLERIKGHLDIRGDGGTDTLTLTDRAAGSGQFYTVSATTVQRSNAAPIAYNGVEGLSLTTTPTNDLLTVASTAAGTPLTLTNGGGQDLLVGPNAATTWRLMTLNGGSLSGTALGSDVSFTSFTQLHGGSDTDRFVVAPGASVAHAINGGGGTRNVLDYQAWSTDVYVNLVTGRTTAVPNGTVANLQDVVGGSGNDILVGDDQSNLLDGGPGRDLLIGGGRNLQRPDELRGGAGEDILIAGYTAWDQDVGGELGLIRAEWTRPTDYATRVSNLMSGQGVPALNAATVRYNHAVGGNRLVGGDPELDFFFGNLALDIHDRGDLEQFVSIT